MTRPRNKKRHSNVPRHIDPTKLPAYVYYDHRGLGRWYVKLYDRASKRCTAEIRLGNGKLTQNEIWQAWQESTNQVRNTFQWLSGLYLQSLDFKELAKDTQTDYRRYAARISKMEMQSGVTLGEKPLTWWTRARVQRYLDKRKEQRATVTSNREVSFMRTVFKWGLNRGHVPEEIGNPAIGPKRHKEKPRTRYVEDWEYQLVFDLAKKRLSWYMPWVMELMYLCRARQIEILSLQLDQIKEEGLLIRRRKGSLDNITQWSSRLENAVTKAADHPQRPDNNIFLFPAQDGPHIRSSSFQTAWQRLMKEALKQGLKEKFTSEDLKPKGTSDTDGNVHDKMQATGHKSPSMVTRVYDRLPNKVKPVK